MNTGVWRFSALLALSLLTACGSLQDGKKDKDDKGGGDEHATFLHEKQGDGSYVTLVDARSESEWVYLDLEERREISADEAADSPSWDLAFQRYRVRTNSGTSGSGGGGALSLAKGFDAVSEAPDGDYLVDDEESPGVDNDPAYAFHSGKGWYSYDLASHLLAPRELVYVLRSAEGNYFKIEMLSYYDEAGSPGFLSFRWARLPDREPVEALDGGCRIRLASSAGEGVPFELCELESGPARHVRIEGIKAGKGHNWAQLLLGYADPPQSAQGAVSQGHFRLMVYGGTPNTLHLALGEISLSAVSAHDFSSKPATLCFDLHDGENPGIDLWVDGENGADCENFETLNKESALPIDGDWSGQFGELDLGAKALFWQADGLGNATTITLLEQPVSSCETVWEGDSSWQPLCQPLGGAHRFRVEQVLAEQNSRYLYLILGEQADPEGVPQSEAGDGKVIVNAGLSHQGASWTWFGMGAESSTQFSFSDDEEEPLYVLRPSTFCVEVFGRDGGGSGLWMWADGALGAHCDDHSTLGPESLLHEELWDEPLAQGLLNYVKTSNSGIAFTRVVVSNDRVASD